MPGPDLKITSLAVKAQLASTDYFEIVDPSDQTDSPLGTSKRVAGSSVLKPQSNLADVASPTAALTSLGGAALIGGNTFTGTQTVNSGTLNVTSVTQRIKLTLNHPPDAYETANTLAVRHTAIGGAAAVEFVDSADKSKGAVGYINPSLTTTLNAFASYSYLEGCNIDGGQPPGVELVWTGYYGGTYHTRPFDRMLPTTGVREEYLPIAGAEIGTIVRRRDSFGNVDTGIANLSADAPGGLVGFPLRAADPTGVPLWNDGYARGYINPTNGKFWFFNADATKSLPLPTWYLALNESVSGSAADGIYNGPGWFVPQGTGGTPTAPGVNGSGFCRRFNGVDQGLYLDDYVRPGDVRSPGNVNYSFYLSMWVRPQTAFTVPISRLWSKENSLNLFISATGQVGADFNSVLTIAPAAATQLTLNTWAFVRLWRDHSAKTFNLQINGGAIQSTNYGLLVPNTQVTARACVGFEQSGVQCFSGDIDEICMYQDDCLTAPQRDSHYNAGAARVFRWASGWSEPAGGSGVWKFFGPWG